MAQFSFAKVALNRATVAVDFGDDNILHVDYSPDRLTSKFALEMTALNSAAGDGAQAPDKAEASINSAVDALMQLVTGWDAEEAFSRDFLLDLPMAHLSKILSAVMADQAGEASAPTG